MTQAQKTQTQTSTKKPVFLRVKDVKDHTKYKALVDVYTVSGLTAGGREAVEEIVTRMAEAKADLVDKVKSVVATVADNVATASGSGAVDIGMAMGVYFHLGEYMVIAVKIQRITYPRAVSRWWGVVGVSFKGFDGHASLSRHTVKRYVEFYTDKVDRDKLYSILYETARTAFNAYGYVLNKKHAP